MNSVNYSSVFTLRCVPKIHAITTPPKKIWQTCILTVQMKSSLLYLFYMYFSISNSRSFVSMASFKLNDPIVECVSYSNLRSYLARRLACSSCLVTMVPASGVTRAGNYEENHHPPRQALRNGLKLHPWRLAAGTSSWWFGRSFFLSKWVIL